MQATTTAALALALALAGCGGDGDGAAPEGDAEGQAVRQNPVAQAAQRTLEQGTARIAYDAAFEGVEGSYSFNAEGAVDYAQHRTRLDYDMTNLPGTGNEDVDVFIDGPTVLVRFPEDSPDVKLPEGKEWVRIPPPAEPEGGDEGEEQPPPEFDLAGVQQDPTQFLRYLQTGAIDVQEEDFREEVRGTQTRTYTALIDLGRVLEHGAADLGGDDEHRKRARRTVEGLQVQLAGNPLPVTVSIDEEGLVRRLLITFDLKPPGGGGTISALTTTEYYDFGADVDVEPPPDETIIDAADVE